MAFTDTHLRASARLIDGLFRQAAALLRHLMHRHPPLEDRERHRFVQRSLMGNPDAFSSDYDIQTLMLHYPSHF